MASARHLFLLAMDQRDSIEKKLYGLEGAPGPADAASIAAAKLLVYRGLLDAVAELPDGAVPGFLVDEQYGASAAVLARDDASVVLAMPIEASGRQWFDFAYGDAWRTHAEFFRPQHAKVLVRDNPGLDAAERAQQARRLAEVSAWATAGGHALILELLVPATADDLASLDGSVDRYDAEVRPGLTVQAMEFLQDRGVEPAVWKIEGLASRESAERIAAAARRDGRRAQCIVLGRHAPAEQLNEWLRIAAPVEGFLGFAIGRSIWWDVVQGRVAGELDEAEARRRIAENYTGFVRTYVDALGG